MTSVSEELAQLKHEATALLSEISRDASALDKKKAKYSKLSSQIRSLKQTRSPDNPQVTDHAVLRYLERVKGFDIAAVRKEMLTPEVTSAIRVGAVSLKRDGVEYVLQDGMVITVLE